MASTGSIRLIYAANRPIGVRALEIMREAGIEPLALMVADGPKASHAAELKAALPAVPVMEGKGFRDKPWLAQLSALQPDYILSVHFPYLFPPEVLAIPRVGTLNLHPALLPYNRGWHTPSWSILEKTPIGATLHWVDEGVDSGDIALQREEFIRPGDTANTLYQRLLTVELELFAGALPLLKEGRLPRVRQQPGGSAHRKTDLASVQELDLKRSAPIGETIDVLRALTTNTLDETAFFRVEGRRYRVRVEISED